MSTLFLEFDLNIAHRLFEEGGKCENIHGHNLDVKYSITLKEVDLKSKGFVINFSDIKKSAKDAFDHKFLFFKNDDMADVFKSLPGAIPLEFNPSTENIAEGLARIAKNLDNSNQIAKISVLVHETVNNAAEFSKIYE